MKFTKLTSAALVGATVLSILTPTATFAATHEGGVIDNGGTALPQTDTSEIGISFGDNVDNGNTGFLRLQKVPKVLDFGNHAAYDKAFVTFTADGKNYANEKNNTHAAYDNSISNKTPLLNLDKTVTSADGTKIDDVTNNAWVTVVDKQVTRKKTAQMDKATTQQAGDWQLKVKADGALTTDSKQTIDGATLLFKHSKYALTENVFELTNSDQDKTFTNDYAAAIKDPAVAAATGVKAINGAAGETDALTDTFSLALAPTSTEQTVAKAKADTGTGANIFAWAPEDIQLVMPSVDSVANAIYKTSLTWTLSTGK